MKPLPMDKPTRRTIEELFRELANSSNRWDNDEIQAISQELDQLKDELHNVPPVKKLERRLCEARRKHHQIKDAVKEKLVKVRRRYLAKGLTPSVLKEIEKLVETANK